MRWRNNGANEFNNLSLFVHGYAAAEGGSSVVTVQDVRSYATTGTTWQTLTAVLSGTPDDAAQFWQFSISFFQSGTIVAQEIEIDSIFLFPTP